MYRLIIIMSWPKPVFNSINEEKFGIVENKYMKYRQYVNFSIIDEFLSRSC